MTNLVVEKTSRTPYIFFDSNKNILTVEGRSIPENSLQFYGVLFKWADTFYQESTEQKDLEVVFKLEYFNTSSSKCILDFLRKLEKLKQMDVVVKVFWFYDGRDEDMEEVGQDFKEILDLDIELVQNAEKR